MFLPRTHTTHGAEAAPSRWPTRAPRPKNKAGRNLPAAIATGVVLGALVVRCIPFLAEPVHELLSMPSAGGWAPTVAVLIINGIGRYAGKQKTLAESIRAETAKFDRLMSQPTPDQNEVAREQEALLWQTRIFDERRQSLTYVCEVPVLIEQRMFALGRVLRDFAANDR